MCTGMMSDDEERDWFSNAADGCGVRRGDWETMATPTGAYVPVPMRDASPEPTQDWRFQAQELDEHRAATAAASSSTDQELDPSSRPVILVGSAAAEEDDEDDDNEEVKREELFAIMDQSELQGEHAVDVREVHLRSPYLTGKRSDLAKPTFTVDVHIAKPNDIEDLLYLVSLQPRFRMLLLQIKEGLNSVACMQNEYFAQRHGGRSWGKGPCMQFLPGFARNLLFGQTCVYIDMVSAAFSGLVNMKRVLKILVDTPQLDLYWQNPHNFRTYIKSGLTNQRVPVDEMRGMAKKIILWAVHGYKHIDKHIKGRPLHVVQALARECALLTSAILDHELMSDVMSHKRNEDAAIALRETTSTQESKVSVEEGEEEQPIGPRKRGRPPKKKGKKAAPDVFMRADDELEAQDGPGQRLTAIYQIVESETLAAMFDFFQKQPGWAVQILIHDGMVIRPVRECTQMSAFDNNIAIKELLDPCRRYVTQMTGWDMKCEVEDMTITREQRRIINGEKVFHSIMQPFGQIVRAVKHHFGEKLGFLRFGSSFLVPNKHYPGFYEIWRHTTPGSTVASLGPAVEAGAEMAKYLSKSAYAPSYTQLASADKKLMEWFLVAQDELFPKINRLTTNLYNVRYQDGIVDFNANNNEPTFRTWQHYKENDTPIPQHFMAYPHVSYLKALEHFSAYSEGKRDDSPTPVWDQFISYQIAKEEDRRLLHILMGRAALPLRDGWNVGLVITGPEQIGKSVILGEVKARVPFGGVLIKVVSGKSSERAPLGDLSDKVLVVSDEAETLINKLGNDVLKALLSNGSFDSDVKYKAETSMPDGPRVQLVAVGNTFYDQSSTIDKATVERIAHFQFENLVKDGQRDPTLAQKIAAERGVLHALQVHLYLQCLRDPDQRNKFWSFVATPTMRALREQSKSDKDMVEQLLNNHSTQFVIRANPDAKPVLKDELEKTLREYYKEREVDWKKCPNNWIETVKRNPCYAVKRVKFCRHCQKCEATAADCGVHYSIDKISDRWVIKGMDIHTLQFGVRSGEAAAFMEKEKVAPPVEAPASVSAAAAAAPSPPRPKVFPRGNPSAPAFDPYQTLNSLAPEVRLEIDRISRMPQNGRQQEGGLSARTVRRHEAQRLLPGMNIQQVDAVLRLSQADPPQRVFYLGEEPVQVGDSYKPCP